MVGYVMAREDASRKGGGSELLPLLKHKKEKKPVHSYGKGSRRRFYIFAVSVPFRQVRCTTDRFFVAAATTRSSR